MRREVASAVLSFPTARFSNADRTEPILSGRPQPFTVAICESIVPATPIMINVDTLTASACARVTQGPPFRI
jgi:hypothetical protein